MMKTNQVATFEFELFKKFSSHDIFPIADSWRNKLLGLGASRNVDISGELRRGKSSISHIDIVVETEYPRSLKKEISAMPEVKKIVATTSDHIEIRIQNDIAVYIWLASPHNFATVLFYTTGPNSHTDKVNNLAAQMDVQVSFHGVWENGRLLDITKEAEIYQTIKLPAFPPELRDQPVDHTSFGDLNFENLINHSDIRSDLHTHSNWSDGKNSIEEMVCAAILRNLSVLAITDHSPYILKHRYNNTSYFDQQSEIIEQLQNKYQPHITILKGVEVDILPDGTLDLPDNKLKDFDIVVASLHVALDQPQEDLTDRLIHAIENPLVDIIGHPGGRLFPMHDHADLNWERVIQAAAFNRVALEINSHKAQPLFDDIKVRMAVDSSVAICINSDAHATAMLDQSIFGINIARRAGLKKSQVINTWSPKRLDIWLKRKAKITSMVQ